MLTKEELDKIFNDIDASLKLELNRKPPVKIKLIRTNETDNCEDIFVADSEIDEILSRIGTDIKSRDKPIKRTLLKRIKKSLIILLQKLVFRKKTDYYKRMEAIKKQWVTLYTRIEKIILTLLKAEMPPGWRKAVNSGSLMESFARVDKYRWSPERSLIARRCGVCSKEETEDISLRTNAVSDMIVDILKNIDCQRYSRDQLVNVLVKLKCLAKHGHQYEQGWILFL